MVVEQKKSKSGMKYSTPRFKPQPPASVKQRPITTGKARRP